MSERRYSPMGAYAKSKRANVAEGARLWQESEHLTGVTFTV